MTANAVEVLLPANCGANGVVLTFQLQTIDWQTRKAKLLDGVSVAILKAAQRNIKKLFWQ